MKNKMTITDLKQHILSEIKKLRNVEVLKEERSVLLKKLNENEEIDSISDPSKPIMRSDLVGSPYTEKIGYSRLPNLDIVHAVEFVPSGTFGANSNAERYLEEMGYKIGSMEGPNPIGFSNKYNRISKWGNMTSEDHTKLDGVLISDGEGWREGGAIIMWFNPPTY
jgi:hypothetical protein